MTTPAEAAAYAAWIEREPDPELRGWRVLAAALRSACPGGPDALTELVILSSGRAAGDVDPAVVAGIVRDLPSPPAVVEGP